MNGLFARFSLRYARWLARLRFARAQAEDGEIILGPEYCWNFHLFHPERLHVGRGTVINGDFFCNALGGVKIGRYVHIARGLTVYSHNHDFRSADRIPYGDRDILKPVTIGDAVWIGANVSIAPGAVIGDGAIVGIGSVVFGEVPRCAIVRGNPAVVVGQRDEATFDRLVGEGRYG